MLVGFVENLPIDVVDDLVPLARLHRFGNRLVVAHRVFELVEEHAIDLHALGGDLLDANRFENVVTQMLVSAAGRRRRVRALPLDTRRLWKLDHLVVLELGLEVLARCEEVEKLERGLRRLGDVVLEVLVEELLQKVVGAGAAPLDLDEVRGREDRAKQPEVQDIRAVVARGHHADGDAYAGLAGLVGGNEVARPQQVVVGEVDGELLRVGDLRRDLHGEVGLVFGRI